MRKRQFKIFTLTMTMAGMLSLFSPNAVAIDQGDWLVRFGVANVNPDDDSGAVTGISGSGVGVDSDTTLGVTVTYMFRQNWGIELLASLPFEHDINGEGTLASLGKIADAEQLPPTVSVQYHFSPQSNIRPYVGGGINFIFFSDEDATASLEGALGGPTDVELDDSSGLALQAGVDIDFNEKWFFNFAVWLIDADTDAELKTGGVTRKVDVDIDPWVYLAGVGIKF